MGFMDGWDIALLVIAGYVAVVALIRLMTRRRDQMIDEFREEVEKEQNRKAAQRRREAQQQRSA